MILALLLALQVEVAAPAGADLSKPFRVVRVSDSVEVPAQVHGGKIVLWATSGEHRVEAAEAKAHGDVTLTDVDGKRLLASYGGKRLVQYNYGHIEPPAGVDAVFGRSGYLHPLWNPSGQAVTNDHPPKHLHHHGVWFPWTSSEFEGRKSDFWNSKSKQGKVECTETKVVAEGPVFAAIRAKHRFVNLNAPEGPKPALDEVWEIRVYRPDSAHTFDLVSTQTCATSAPLLIKKYYYGGLGLRGSGEWEGKDGVEFLTSEGKDRKTGNETTGRWCSMTGTLDGKKTSIGVLCHPSNFRFPQGMRLHPEEPFFNFAPSQGGDFAIEPGKPYVSRYRIVVADGLLGTVEMERRWKEWVEPAATLR